MIDQLDFEVKMLTKMLLFNIPKSFFLQTLKLCSDILAQKKR